MCGGASAFNIFFRRVACGHGCGHQVVVDVCAPGRSVLCSRVACLGAVTLEAPVSWRAAWI
eukprot:1561833-Pyramimonas_sp.AAC.1